VLACGPIAASSPRLVGLMFGAEDFTRDLGLPPRRDGDGTELLYARSAVVLAAAAARVAAIDAVWPNLRDVAGLQREAGMARRLGFTGKAVIHPAQIAPVNRTFSPTDEELRFAREVIAAVKLAEAQGHGTAALQGQLVDAPVVERARRVLLRAEQAHAMLPGASQTPGATP
ncbi:MAG: HpcH/HpaI aldolase/citrate lyase family protein, partial [Chloroflexota bacterium]